MASRTLSAKEISKIIASCHKYGVRELKLFEDLYIVMDHAKPAKSRAESAPTAAIPGETNENVIPLNQEAEQLSEEKERTSLLLIEDPLEMENRIANEELIDDHEAANN